MQDQPRQDLRALKALVIGMGVLIVIGTAVVVGVIVHRLYAKFSAPSTPRAATAVATAVPPGPAGPPPPATTLAPGERIRGLAAAGPELGILVTGPGGDRVLLFDPASGRLTQLLATQP